MAHRITPEQEKAQDRSRAAMLATEAALATSLLAVFRSARTERALRQGIASAVVMGRQAARATATSSAVAQLDAIGVSVEALPPVVMVDAERAAQSTRGTLELFTKRRAELIEAGLGESAAATEAAQSVSWKASQIATTEAADLWTEEAARVGKAAGKRFEIWKIWDAVLDRGTCSVCAGSHGMAIRADQQFPAGEPGQVHPGCRCMALLVTREQVDPVVATKGAPKGKPAIVVAPGAKQPATQAPAAAAPTKPTTQGATATTTTPDGRRVIAPIAKARPRKIDAVNLPGSPGFKPGKTAVFAKGRPPRKEEVTARKRAQRIADRAAQRTP